MTINIKDKRLCRKQSCDNASVKHHTDYEKVSKEVVLMKTTKAMITKFEKSITSYSNLNAGHSS